MSAASVPPVATATSVKAEVRPAATVLLVRDRTDADGGVEVLMMQRHLDSVFAGGAWVFPGGRVDRDDAAGCPGIATAPPDDLASRLVGVPAGGRAYWVAVARECFEECGLLLAVDDRTGAPVDGRDRLLADRLATQRLDLLGGTRSFPDILAAEGLSLALGDVLLVSRWITPPGPPRRFDTRFFVAPAPAGQEASSEGSETVDWLWTSPQQALDRFNGGEIHLMRPTIANLASLAQFPSTAAVLATVRAFGPARPVAPTAPRTQAPSTELLAAMEELWPI